MKYDYGLKPLKFWCQKVLPLVYDESLSYEELLCKVVAYLNEVIEGFNGIPEYIQSLVSDERLQEILSELLNELEEQVASWNEQENENATKDMSDGELVWLNNKLYQMTRNILAGDKYVISGSAGVTPNVTKVTVEGLIGNLKKLTTTEKGNLVSSINELLSKLNTEKGRIDGIIDTIGDLAELTTTNKNSVVSSINEVNAKAGANSSKIGNLDNLTTTEKENLVGAVNEVLSTCGDLDNLSTTVKTSLVNAINEVLSDCGDLDNLDTTDKASLVSAINEVLEIANTGKFVVNVKDFGATGNGTTNDYNAINSAILYATQHDASIIYFPKGKYNCGSGTFDIDASRITFLGTGASVLISSGLTNDDAFITITSPVTLEQYDYPRTPLIGMTIVGNYFTDRTATGVYGIKMGTDSTFVAPHTMLYNVVIRNFAIGLGLTSAYKTSYINVSIIACNIGIYVPSAGVQQAVPCNFYTFYAECCNTAIYGLSGGFNNISFFGGAFEYNRSVHNCYTKLVFIGVRFEYDCKASCDSNLTVRPVFQGSALGGSSTVIKYHGCFFLGLNNFESNVGYWISNPYKASAYNISPFYITGGSKVSLEMINCEIADVNVPSGVYYIGTDKFFGTGNYIHDNAIQDIVNPSYVVTETDGFIGN